MVTEARAEYSWTIPYDMETLISFMGGPQTTETRLDTMFIPGLKTTGTGTGGGNGIGTTLFNPGKLLNLLKRNFAPQA